MDYQKHIPYLLDKNFKENVRKYKRFIFCLPNDYNRS